MPREGGGHYIAPVSDSISPSLFIPCNIGPQFQKLLVPEFDLMILIYKDIVCKYFKLDKVWMYPAGSPWALVVWYDELCLVPDMVPSESFGH